MKKIVIVICVLVVLGLGGIYVYDEIRAYKTVGDMALDRTNTIVTEIWDEDNISRYNALAIPDTTIGEFSNYGYEYAYAKVTDIGEAAFQGNIWLESVYIPVNIVRIQKNAFNGCNSIQFVSYAGTEAQWKQIVIESGNDILKYIPVEYNAKMPRTKDFE